MLLSRLSGQKNVVIGTPAANRNRTELEGLIGFFVNTLALRIDLSAAPSVSELLEQVKGVLLQAHAHQDIPFEQVVDALSPVRSLAHGPLFQVMFAWQNNDLETFDFPDLTVAKIPHNRPVAKVDLILDLRERDGRIIGNIFYATSLFDRVTIERYAGYLQNALSMIAASN